MKIEFFEPPMCCPTGICGPSVDERLVRLKENIELLEKKYEDLEISRYMLSTHPLKFRTNREVYQLIQENGRKALPITAVNRKVMKTGDYPSLEEMESYIADAKEEKSEN